MLLLTLGSGVCTVAVGYLSARTASGIARDLRRGDLGADLAVGEPEPLRILRRREAEQEQDQAAAVTEREAECRQAIELFLAGYADEQRVIESVGGIKADITKGENDGREQRLATLDEAQCQRCQHPEKGEGRQQFSPGPVLIAERAHQWCQHHHRQAGRGVGEAEHRGRIEPGIGGLDVITEKKGKKGRHHDQHVNRVRPVVERPRQLGAAPALEHSDSPRPRNRV